jgi:hypothetical protein
MSNLLTKFIAAWVWIFVATSALMSGPGAMMTPSVPGGCELEVIFEQKNQLSAAQDNLDVSPLWVRASRGGYRADRR